MSSQSNLWEDDQHNQELCMALLQAESEDEIVRILTDYGYWDNPEMWRQYGDNENNFSIIGNQQSSPAAAMIEKFVNSIDAVLMRECLFQGNHPEGSDAPKSISDALQLYFVFQMEIWRTLLPNNEVS
jgi:hypothetical protein